MRGQEISYGAGAKLEPHMEITHVEYIVLGHEHTQLIDPSKFVSKCWFNDLTNVTFHKSPNIAIATHMNHLHMTHKTHI
jgi:hypothetical protein